jgi:hypothetical protein
VQPLASSESLSGPKLFSRVRIQIFQLCSGCNLLFFRRHRFHQPHSECNVFFIRGDRGSRFESLDPNFPTLFRMQPLVLSEAQVSPASFGMQRLVHSRRQGISLASSESWSGQNLFSKVLIQISPTLFGMQTLISFEGSDNHAAPTSVSLASSESLSGPKRFSQV